MKATNKLEWIKRLLAECRRQGVSDSELARRLGVSRQTVSTWKSRGLPMDRLEESARSVGINVEYLKTGMDVARFHHQLTEEERRVVAAMRELEKDDSDQYLQPLLALADKVRRYKSR